MSKRQRKPSRRRKFGADNGPKYDYFDGAKGHNLRSNDRMRRECMDALVAMGYDREQSIQASNKHPNIVRAVDYLLQLEKVQSSGNGRLGYSDSLRVKGNKKRKMEQCDQLDNVLDEQRGQRRKRGKIMSECDDDEKRINYR